MRITRAALRAQTHDEPALIHEDENLSDDMQPDCTVQLTRPVLKDITDENLSLPENSNVEGDGQSNKKANVKRKGRTPKQEIIEPLAEQEIVLRVVDHSDRLLGSPARVLDIASAEQNGEVEGKSGQKHGDILDAKLAAQTEMTEQGGETIQTPAHAVTNTSKNPKFDPTQHISLNSDSQIALSTGDDSFVTSIKTRSPRKAESISLNEVQSPDSFIEHIRSRSPAKVPSRIEDSVEAIDALEEAIEKISGNLPTMNELIVEPQAMPKSPSPPTKTDQSAQNLKMKAQVPSKDPLKDKKSPMTKLGHTSNRGGSSKPTVSRTPIVNPKIRPTIVSKPQSKQLMPGNTRKTGTTPSKPEISFSKSPTKTQPNTVKKRTPSDILSTSKPGFIPAKSTKPVTKPTFVLPGDAMSAKYKAQREERLKREEAEKTKKEFKARPAPSRAPRPSVLPRENKASQARLSRIISGSDKENIAPRSVVGVPRKSSSELAVAKTRPEITRANSGARRTTSVTTVVNQNTNSRTSSANLLQKSIVTKEDAAQQKVRGKAVFGRTKAEISRLEKEKKDKEEAAKKARAEAAERGRLASREWAEKQKRKQSMQSATKNTSNADQVISTSVVVA